VGFDDHRELNLEGARSALPIWTEFMKRAAKLPEYGDAKPFRAPRGIVSEAVCSNGHLATSYCPNTRTEYFIDGSQPVTQCSEHSYWPVAVADRVLIETPAADLPGSTRSAEMAPNVPFQQ
jgi:penicillin-binding protein 1B